MKKMWVPITAVLVMAGAAAAAITLTYQNASQLSVSSTSAPVQFEAGADSAPSDYVTAFSLSTNRTSFTAALAGVPEATVVTTDLFRLKNVDDRAHTVTLATSQVSNAFVLVYTIEFFDGATKVGTLDLKSASPSATFVDLAAGKSLTARTTLTLAGGAGANNVAESRAISLATSP